MIKQFLGTLLWSARIIGIIMAHDRPLHSHLVGLAHIFAFNMWKLLADDKNCYHFNWSKIMNNGRWKRCLIRPISITSFKIIKTDTRNIQKWLSGTFMFWTSLSPGVRAQSLLNHTEIFIFGYLSFEKLICCSQCNPL